MATKFDVLTAEVKSLKAENSFIHSEISLLNKGILERLPLATRPRRTYAAAAASLSSVPGNQPSTSVPGKQALTSGAVSRSTEITGAAVKSPTTWADCDAPSASTRATASTRAKEGIQMSHKPVSTLGHLMPRPKDRPPKERAQGVIYQIPCANCPATYIGETKNFKERLRQHKTDVRKFDHERSEVAEHSDSNDHRIDFDDTRILDIETNSGKGSSSSHGTFKPHRKTSIGRLALYRRLTSAGSATLRSRKHHVHRRHGTSVPMSVPMKETVASVCNAQAVNAAFEGVDCVIHCASLIDVDLFPDVELLEAVNVQGTRNVIEACVRQSVPLLVFTGTVSSGQGGKDQSAATHGYAGPYGESKERAARLVMAASGRRLADGETRLRTLVLHQTPIYGEQDQRLVTEFMRCAGWTLNTLVRIGKGFQVSSLMPVPLALGQVKMRACRDVKSTSSD
ncbi:hypothetical protein ISCGN_007249 [Ixodes scapularis]